MATGAATASVWIRAPRLSGRRTHPSTSIRRWHLVGVPDRALRDKKRPRRSPPTARLTEIFATGTVAVRDHSIVLGGAVRTFSSGLVAAATVVRRHLAVPATAKPPSPPLLTCGQTITKSTTLQRDLIGCTGPGLVVGAPGITLDLNGHVIQSISLVFDESGFPDGPNSGPGDRRSAGFDRLTVKNGRIEGFTVSVFLQGADRAVIPGISTPMRTSSTASATSWAVESSLSSTPMPR